MRSRNAWNSLLLNLNLNIDSKTSLKLISFIYQNILSESLKSMFISINF